jgi:hypothetical protein
MDKQILLLDIFSSEDRDFIQHGFKRFGIKKHYLELKKDSVFKSRGYSCLTCSLNDIQSVINIYEDKIKECWKASYITSKRKWMKIYNVLKVHRERAEDEKSV